MTISSPDGLWTERGRTLVSCLCPFFILCLDTRSETTHMERPVCRKRSVLYPNFPLCRHRAQSRDWPVAFKYRLSSIKPVKTYRFFSLQQHNTANSTDQVRKIRSRLSTLFVRGYKLQLAACEYAFSWCSQQGGLLKNYMYHNYHRAFTTMKVLVERQAAQQLQLCSSPLGRPQGHYSLLNFCGLGLFFRWTRRRCCSRNLLSHALFLLCWPQAK